MRRTLALLVPLLVFAQPDLASPDDETKTFEILVVDDAGDAVEDATIWVRLPEAIGQTIRPIRSDVAGKARLPGLDPRRQYQLNVTAPASCEDLGDARMRGWFPEDGAVVTLPPGRTIRGTAVDEDGRPTQAIVWYETHQGRSGGNSTFGHFELRGLPRVPVDLVATLPGVDLLGRYKLRSSAPWVRVPVSTSNARLPLWTDIPAEDRRQFRVLVTGPDGVIPARATVEAGYGSRHTSTTARRGRTAINLQEQAGKDAFVRVYAARDAEGKPLPWAPTRVVVPPDRTRVHVQMLPGLEVSGHVHDAAGVPQAGLRILATDDWGGVSTTSATLAEAWSEEDGSFRLVGLGEGEIQIAAAKSRNFPASASVRCHGGDTDVVVVVREASSVELTIVDPEGRPVVGAACVLWQRWETKTGSGGRSLANSETNAEGRAVLPQVDPGLLLKLEVEVPASRDDLAPLSVEPWVPTSELLTMPRGFAATIRVVDEAGDAVNAVVRKRVLSKNPPFDGGGWSSVDVVDESGQVVVRGLTVDEIHEFKAVLEVESKVFPGCSPWTRVTPSQPDIVLRIPGQGHRMTVRAAGARRGQIGILFSERSGSFSPSHLSLEFDKDGVALVDNVGAGEYSILVLATGPDQAEYESGRVAPFEFTGGEVEVTLEPRTHLRITAVSESAAEVVGFVQLQDGSPLELRPDEDGTLWTDLLPKGRYPVLLFAEIGGGYLRGEGWADTGETTEIELHPE